MCKDKEGEEEVSMRCSDPIEQGDWRYGMFDMLAKVRKGELPHMNADEIHIVMGDFRRAR